MLSLKSKLAGLWSPIYKANLRAFDENGLFRTPKGHKIVKKDQDSEPTTLKFHEESESDVKNLIEQ